MKRNKLIESRIISLWNKIYPETKLHSKRPGKTVAALLRKNLKEKELIYLNKVLMYLGKTMYLDKVMQALLVDEKCEICGNICHPNHHNICMKCYSFNIDKYKLIRRKKAHDKIQELRSNSLRNRSTEAKAKTLKKFRKTMASNWEGGLSRLIHHFQSLHKGDIISYADKRWATGNSYLKSGFKQLKDSKPGYFYIRDNLIISRYQAQKHKLQSLLKDYDPELSETENMLNSGFIRVADLGQYVFVKTKK